MDEFMERRKGTSGKYNFLSIAGGKYWIPNDPKIIERFWKLFTGQKEKTTSLVFRMAPADHMPLVFDFDIKSETEEQIPDESYKTLICELTQSIARLTRIKELNIIATRKRNPTTGDECFKNGFHVYCQGVYVTRLKAIEIREQFYNSDSYQEFRTEFGVLEPPIDDVVMPIGKNGLVLISDRKPGRKEGYHIFMMGRTRGTEWEEMKLMTKQEGDEILASHAAEIYAFVFEEQFWPLIGFGEKVRQVTKTRQPENKTFNLQAFLDATQGWAPTYLEYLNIVWYLASIRYPREKTVELCNQYWKPQNPLETGAKYDSLPPHCEHPITKGSIIHFLKLHGRNVNYNEIFPPKMKNRVQVYYNQYNEVLLKRPVSQLEIESYFSDMIVYIYSEQVFAFKYFVDETDNYGNMYRRVMTKITKKQPFCGIDALDIQCLPSLDEMVALLTEMIKNKHNKKKSPALMSLISKIHEKKVTLQEALDTYTKIMAVPWVFKNVPTDKFIPYMMRKRKLTEYAEINFRPYAGGTCPLPKTVLNTFDGYPLDDYVANKRIKIEDTLIYEYLCKVFGHSDRMNLRLSELLDRVAFKLQHPEIRTGRIHAISAEKQGIGKSCWFSFLSMIFSSKYCVFHENIDTYLSNFNWHLHSKLIHFIDDLQACSKTQTRKLYSKVTSNRILVEKKGETPIPMNEFSELWITGNQNSCSLHVCAEDRRIIIYKASPSLKGQKQFWTDLHKEFKNLDIAKAWFDYLQGRDVTKFDYQQNTLDSQSAKLESITDCMPKSHIFINRYFSTEEFMSTYWNHQQIQLMERKGGPYFRVDEQTMYHEYKVFVGRFYNPSAVRHIHTFRRELERIGLVCPKKRQKLFHRNRWVVHLEYKSFQRAFAEQYKTDPHEWYITSHIEEYRKLQTNG